MTVRDGDILGFMFDAMTFSQDRPPEAIAPVSYHWDVFSVRNIAILTMDSSENSKIPYQGTELSFSILSLPLKFEIDAEIGELLSC